MAFAEITAAIPRIEKVMCTETPQHIPAIQATAGQRFRAPLCFTINIMSGPGLIIATKVREAKIKYVLNIVFPQPIFGLLSIKTSDVKNPPPPTPEPMAIPKPNPPAALATD